MPFDAPQFMREAAQQGLKYYEEGLGGDGLTSKTISEARGIARGEVSENKWVRIAAWIARHMPDLDAPAADPDNEDYPSPGVVAHLLWGSGPSKEAARRAEAYASNIVRRLEEEANRMTEASLETRIETGDPVIVSDIDETLIGYGAEPYRIDSTWEFIQSLEGELFLVTGRPESDRAETEAQLESLDITYSRLIMNPGSTADSVEYKTVTMETLLETYNVIVAIENDDDTRDAYRALGVETVDPEDIGKTPDAGYDMEDDMNRSQGAKMEQRVNVTDFEIREEGDGMTLTGYASVFGQPSEPLPFREYVAPGAFTRSLKSRNDVKLLWNHDTGTVLGSTRAGTLKLVEDSKGLRVEASLPETTAGKDAAILIRRGDVTGFSFGFSVIKDSWNKEGTERTLNQVRLHEVSLTPFPAYTQTNGTAQVRSLDLLAQRAEVDVNELSEALSQVEAGEDITMEQKALLSRVIDKLAPTPEPPADDLGMLALKKKKLELLEM